MNISDDSQGIIEDAVREVRNNPAAFQDGAVWFNRQYEKLRVWKPNDDATDAEDQSLHHEAMSGTFSQLVGRFLRDVATTTPVLKREEVDRIMLATSIMFDPEPSEKLSGLTVFHDWKWDCKDNHGRRRAGSAVLRHEDSRKWIDLVRQALKIRQYSGAGKGEQRPIRTPPGARQDTDWRNIRKRLEQLCKQGEPYTGQRDFATRLGCSLGMVNKAIKSSKTLKAWMAGVRHAKPRMTGLTEVVTDNTPQTTESDPGDALAGDDVQTEMARLIDEARERGKPKEVARLNALNDEQRRELVATCYEQKLDAEPSPLNDDPTDRRPPQVKHFKRP